MCAESDDSSLITLHWCLGKANVTKTKSSSRDNINVKLHLCEVVNLEVKFKSRSLKRCEDLLSIISSNSFFWFEKKHQR